MPRPAGQLWAGVAALLSLSAMLAVATFVLVPNLRPSLGSDRAGDGSDRKSVV